MHASMAPRDTALAVVPVALAWTRENISPRNLKRKYHIMTLIQNLDHIYYISEKAGLILFMTEDMLFTLLQDTVTD